MTHKNVYIDGSGWNGKESKVCIAERDEFNQYNKNVKIIRYEYQLTNNEAEYYALIEALKHVKSGDIIYTDSQLILGQLFHNWKINYEHLRNLVNIVKAFLNIEEKKEVKIIQIPREQNYAGKVLDE